MWNLQQAFVLRSPFRMTFPRIGAAPDMERTPMGWTAIYGASGSNTRVNHEKKTSPSFFSSSPNISLVWSAPQPASTASVLFFYDTSEDESDTRRQSRANVRLKRSRDVLPRHGRDPKPTRRLVFHFLSCEKGAAPKMAHYSRQSPLTT